MKNTPRVILITFGVFFVTLGVSMTPQTYR